MSLSLSGCKKILGENFISPEQICNAHNLPYSPEWESELIKNLPKRKVLEVANRNDLLFMFPLPPKVLTFREIKTNNEDLFYKPIKRKVWYENATNVEFWEDFVGAGYTWVLMKKDLLEKSRNLPWSDQCRLVRGGFLVPNVAMLSYALIGYFKANEKYLFENVLCRVNSLHEGFRVDAGLFDEHGFYVDDQKQEQPHPDAGLTVIKKL